MPNASDITIQLNGDAFTIAAPATIASLIDVRKPTPPFAVELNKQLVRRPDYAAAALSGGDIVEIVTLVGGG